MRWVEATAADETGTWSGGEWVRTLSLPNVYDANRVIVLEHARTLSFDEIAAAASELQRELPQRVVEFADPGHAEALAQHFTEAGWGARDLAIMIRRRAPDRAVDTRPVLVLTEAMIAPARRQALTDENFTDPSTVAEIAEKQRRVVAGVNATLLGIVDQGEVVSYCEVYDLGEVAQIEAVATLPAQRQQGHSRRVLSRALELVRGHRLVFLGADPLDWPQQLYGRLGFDHAGLLHRFLRPPQPRRRADAVRVPGRGWSS